MNESNERRRLPLHKIASRRRSLAFLWGVCIFTHDPNEFLERSLVVDFGFRATNVEQKSKERSELTSQLSKREMKDLPCFEKGTTPYLCQLSSFLSCHLHHSELGCNGRNTSRCASRSHFVLKILACNYAMLRTKTRKENRHCTLLISLETLRHPNFISKGI